MIVGERGMCECWIQQYQRCVSNANICYLNANVFRKSDINAALVSFELTSSDGSCEGWSLGIMLKLGWSEGVALG